jgi:hypothetical protein
MSTGERSRFFRASALLCSQAQSPRKSVGAQRKKIVKKTKTSGGQVTFIKYQVNLLLLLLKKTCYF